MTFSKEERERNKKLLLTTLNYLLEYHSGDMVFDDYSPSKQWYLDELRKTDSDIKNSRSAQIKRRLDMHIGLLKYCYDLGLNSYIKENTGYDIDIFEEFKAAVVPIISKGSIENNDVYPVEKYLRAYETHPDQLGNVRLLKALLAEREAEIIRRRSGETIIIKKAEFFTHANGKTISPTEHQRFMDSWLMYEVIAPNGLYKLSIQISGTGEYALTYVNISLHGGTGGVYGAKGKKLPIKAYWKDDDHVIIETKNEYEPFFSYQQVSSYGDVVKIEYRFT